MLNNNYFINKKSRVSQDHFYLVPYSRRNETLILKVFIINFIFIHVKIHKSKASKFKLSIKRTLTNIDKTLFNIQRYV